MEKIYYINSNVSNIEYIKLSLEKYGAKTDGIMFTVNKFYYFTENNKKIITINNDSKYLDLLLSNPNAESIDIGIEDKTIVWAYNEGDIIWSMGIYDEPNKSLFQPDGSRNGVKYDNYEPVPKKLIPKKFKELINSTKK